MKKLTYKKWARSVVFILFCLLATFSSFCGLGAWYAYEVGLYEEDDLTFEESYLCEECVYYEAQILASYITHNGVDELDNLDNFSSDENFYYILKDSSGQKIENTVEGECTVYGTYILTIYERSDYNETYYDLNYINGEVNYETDTGDETASDETDYETDTGDETVYYIEAYVSETITGDGDFAEAYNEFTFLYGNYKVFLPAGIISAIIAILLFIFLMYAVGRREGEEKIALKGLNRIPLELYLGPCTLLTIMGINAIDFHYHHRSIIFGSIVIALSVFAISVLFLALCISLSARLKAGKWWRNTLVFMILRLIYRAIKGVIKALPLVWKTVIAYVVFAVLNLLFLFGCFYLYIPLCFIFFLMLDIAVFVGVIQFSLQMRRLQKAGKALAEGDLTYTVDTSKLWLDLKKHGENLNNISLGMSKAVDERMKSERFKTELITNVSHDLKTPLTSIVTYVDLLKKENLNKETAVGYLEVIDRQSAKLKKLTEDIVEASKASSGAISVNKEKLNIAELLNQSTGEYAERLAAAGIEPVVSVPEEETIVCADGRLLWRVLDNLIQNVCKYALSGTRVYLKLDKAGDDAVITIKNISATQLNVKADELMERFVRGDGSRSTEGSGLGISIARSLTELMGGIFTIIIDGDLFKVILRFSVNN